MNDTKIKVLIVDDSAIIRKLMEKILSSDPDIEVVGTAIDPYVARDKLVQLKPDVMTLDIEMPRMDGVTFLEKVMKSYPVRTIIISSLSQKGSEIALRALEAGAIDVMAKPAIDVQDSLREIAAEVVARVKAVARARLVRHETKNLGKSPPLKRKSLALSQTTHQILGIASSTGGTEALKVLLPMLPPDIPGTLIVQHMPPGFTKSFANNLNRVCPFEVKEAEEGETVLPGKVLLAPGDFHLEIERKGGFYYTRIHQKERMHGVRPAADYLMNSIAKYAGANSIGVVLTGMGKDGAEGLLHMKEAGSFNISQDEKSCVVYGMPKEAVERGAVHQTLPLVDIAAAIISGFSHKKVA